MNLTEILTDSHAAPSVVWSALDKTFGADVDIWEPEVFRLELQRRGIDPTEALMAKVMGAQTVHTTNTFAYDHDVLFAFALACDGVPAAAEAFHHPTVEQLAWAMHEVDRLAPHPMSEDAGFDPDEIDPAVAMVLLDEGFVQAPLELQFCQDVLDHYSSIDPIFRGEVADKWAQFEHTDPESLQGKLSHDEDALSIQICRLADVKRYVYEHEKERDRIHAKL